MSEGRQDARMLSLMQSKKSPKEAEVFNLDPKDRHIVDLGAIGSKLPQPHAVTDI